MIINPDILLEAYRIGYFPMAEPETGKIYWYSPDPRAIFDLNNFHVPKSLQKKLKSNIFEFEINKNFNMVIKSCANRDDTWISKDIIESYIYLNQIGYAYSFEAYYKNELAGGLYGVAIGGAFFGESMFHNITDASKAALAFLVKTLKKCGYILLDTQYITPHLQKFGAYEIPKNEYLKLLKLALSINPLKFDEVR
ncbi:MAG TPA: leucyl/phenylalanyl-tRNA--protein transferase [Bacteroidota bacterium]|nr:leucyl/phenylalanyl-tRNA--protein transferase [Bacteroidota bacterium]